MKHLNGVAYLMILGFLISSCLSQNVDLKNESKWNCEHMELQETCKTMEDAIACDTLPYCIHCTWNTAFIPEDTIETECAACKDTFQHQSSTSETLQAKYTSSLKLACNLHENEGDKFICLDVVNRSLSWDVTKTNLKLSPLDTCSLLGFCYSQFEVNFQRVRAEKDECSKNEKSEIIYRTIATTATGAKVYRKIGNGKRLNPKSTTAIPIFTPLLKQEQFTKYACDFEIQNIENENYRYNVLKVYAVLIILSTMVFLVGKLCFYILNLQDKLDEQTAKLKEQNKRDQGFRVELGETTI